MFSVGEPKMVKLFGTDGIRGRAGEFPLNRPTVFALGRGLVRLLRPHNKILRIVIGWDTRESSPWLAETLAQGIRMEGGEVHFAGVIPTSAISLLTKLNHFSAGVVISASHNPYEYNGIKIFQENGYKLADNVEAELEKMIGGGLEFSEKKNEGKLKKVREESAGERKKAAEKLVSEERDVEIVERAGKTKKEGEKEGEASEDKESANVGDTIKEEKNPWPERSGGEIKEEINCLLIEKYLDFYRSPFASTPKFSGLKIVVDCANGASSALAPALFESLGFKVTAIHNQPNGRNINAHCGALYPESLAEAVRANEAELGVAYDGDADRAIFVDEKGKILNGDHTLFVQARHLQAKNRLRLPLVVATIMSNMGLEIALARLGLGLIRTRVGDRYVLEAMLKEGANLGGERSGHTIFLDDCPTGDGLLTSLKMAQVIVETGQKLSELCAGLVEWPQILLNIPVKERKDFSLVPGFEAAIQKAKKALGRLGRIEIRYSGTEPVARVMVEAESEEIARSIAEEIAYLLQRHLGGLKPWKN